MSTSPDDPGTFCSTAIARLSIFYADIQDNKDNEADEMQEADDCGVDEGDIDEDEWNGPDVIGEDDGEVDIPSLLIPFLITI